MKLCLLSRSVHSWPIACRPLQAWAQQAGQGSAVWASPLDSAEHECTHPWFCILTSAGWDSLTSCYQMCSQTHCKGAATNWPARPVSWGYTCWRQCGSRLTWIDAVMASGEEWWGAFNMYLSPCNLILWRKSKPSQLNTILSHSTVTEEGECLLGEASPHCQLICFSFH